MGYLQELIGPEQLDSADVAVLRNMIQDNKAALLAKRMGYGFAFFQSPSGLTLVNQNAEVPLARPGYSLGAFGRQVVYPLLGNDFGFAF